MKKILIGLAIFIVLVIGAGYYFITNFIGAGVIGSIEKYEFNVSKQKLEEAINYVIQRNNDTEKINSDNYFNFLAKKNNTQNDPMNKEIKDYYADFSYLAITKNNKYVFRYKKHDMQNSSQITLISGTKYGKGFDLAPNMGYFKKRKYRSMFEYQFISKVRNQLQK